MDLIDKMLPFRSGKKKSGKDHDDEHARHNRRRSKDREPKRHRPKPIRPSESASSKSVHEPKLARFKDSHLGMVTQQGNLASPMKRTTDPGTFMTKSPLPGSSAPSASAAPEPGFILVGIDFGTTFSGVAWAYSKQPNDIKSVTNWDCFDTMNSDKGKAPTRIAYENRSPGDGSNVQMTWGYSVEDANAAEWFKLLLLDESEMDTETRNSPQIRKAKKLLREAGKSPVQAVADYLSLLWKHAVSDMNKDFGEATIEGLPFQVVCTVPAVWNNEAVDKMRIAAERAGITASRFAGKTALKFVSEPEAAALATFEDLKKRPNIKKGDTYVVCDAGGGTVDLISYKVIQTDPLQLEECVEGAGRLCGAVFLDQDFEAVIQQRLGDAWNVPEADKKEMMHAFWENGIKRQFEDQDRKWRLTMPHSCVKLGAPDHLTLEREHVKDIFEHVVTQIRTLVDDQIDAVEEKEGKLPKGIVLVGGFGSCRYIFNNLNRENKMRNIEVLQSQGYKPWTAICRGAVLSALTNSLLRDPVVHSRILRCNYGTAYNTVFDSQVHDEADKYLHNRTGENWAANQMSWYLKRGTNVTSTNPVRLPWVEEIACETRRDKYDFNKGIYTCRAHNPPMRITSAVKLSCRIRTDNPIDTSMLPALIGSDGKEYKDVRHEVEMTVIGTAVEFTIFYQGNAVGRQQLAVELEDSKFNGPSPSPAGALNPASPRPDRQHSGAGAFRRYDAVALWDFFAQDATQHSLLKGDQVVVTGIEGGGGGNWLTVEKEGFVRAVPGNYVRAL